MNHRLTSLRTIRLVLGIACVCCFGGADWLQFRGSQGNSVSDDQNAPTTLHHIAWKVDLDGRGISAPIIIGDRVVLTKSSGFRKDRLHVVCFDAQTGKTLWERQFWATGRTMCHPQMSIATPTPASDGKRIFAFYSTNDVVCLDLDGNLLWFRGLTHDFPNASNSLGMASSPVVVDGTLILQVENDTDSFATGLDVDTGIARWKIDRPRSGNWTTPTVLKGNAGRDDLVLLQSSKGLAATVPQTGEVVWTYDAGAKAIPSTTIVDNIIYVPSGGMTALKPTAAHSTPELLWKQGRMSVATPSPFVYDGRVFSVNGQILICAEARTGKIAWRMRLKGNHTGSPVAAAGHLYLFSQEGMGQIIKPGEKKGKIVDTYDLKETIRSTPAIAGGGLYIRSDAHLWKFVK